MEGAIIHRDLFATERTGKRGGKAKNTKTFMVRIILGMRTAAQEHMDKHKIPGTSVTGQKRCLIC